MEFNKVGLVIGQRGTGKTILVLGSKYSAGANDNKLNIKGLLEIYEKKKMKGLIVDTLDHPSYRKIPIIPQGKFNKWNKDFVRVIIRPDMMKSFVNYLNENPHLNNTFIVFEDAVKYTDSRLSPELKRLIVDSKQRNIDIIFMYHSFSDTPNNIFTKMDFIHLFKTEDKPEVRKNKIRLYEKVCDVYNEVNKNKSRFFGKTIDTRTA